MAPPRPTGPRLSDKPRNDHEREERLQLTMREIAWQLYQKPEQRMTITEICQIPKIMHLKKGCFAKTTVFFAQHADKFMVTGNEGGPNKPDVVSLLMSVGDDFVLSVFGIWKEVVDFLRAQRPRGLSLC